MSNIEYSIDIVSLSKRFKRQTVQRSSYTTLKTSLLSGFMHLIGRNGAGGNFTEAIKDLTLRVPRGASVGVIGQNGSGKSTLLKLITGIYKPDQGKISLNGRVAALIELGAGFHPDFTGRENLYLGGVMHGLSRKQLDQRFQQIVSFAELEDVIDDPVRTYSSGMFMRLGFSLAVHTEPDVLLIDEVLAVGDAAFNSKCKERIAGLKGEGRTLMLVSHDLAAIERWCDEVLWLHKGEVRDRGDPRRVIDHYREFVEHGEEAALQEQRTQQSKSEAAQSIQSGPNEIEASTPQQPQRWGSRELEIKNVTLKSLAGQEQLLFHSEDGLALEFEYLANEKSLINSSDLVFGVCIRRTDGLIVHGSNTAIEELDLGRVKERGRVLYQIKRLGLLEGNYLLDVAIHKRDGYPFDYHQGALTFAVRSQFKQVGVCLPEHRWEVQHA